MRVRPHPLAIPEGSKLYSALDVPDGLDGTIRIYMGVPWTIDAMRAAVAYRQSRTSPQPGLLDIVPGAEGRTLIGDVVRHGWAHPTLELEAADGDGALDEIAAHFGPQAVVLVAMRACVDAWGMGHLSQVFQAEVDALAHPPQPRA